MTIAAILGWIATTGLAILKIVDKGITQYKEVISVIVLRVQKDTADGTWTDEEKEQEAVDIYTNYVKPKLPWYVSLFITEDRIRTWIKQICEKSAGFKGKVSQ